MYSKSNTHVQLFGFVTNIYSVCLLPSPNSIVRAGTVKLRYVEDLTLTVILVKDI